MRGRSGLAYGQGGRRHRELPGNLSCGGSELSQVPAQQLLSQASLPNTMMSAELHELGTWLIDSHETKSYQVIPDQTSSYDQVSLTGSHFAAPELPLTLTLQLLRG